MPGKQLPCILPLAALLLALAPAQAWAKKPKSSERQPAVAEQKAESDAGDGLAHALTYAGRVGTPGYGGLLGYRLRVRHGIGLGLELEGSYAPREYIGGYPTDRNSILHVRTPLFFPVHRSRRLSVALSVAPGIRAIRSADPGFAERSGLAATVDIGVWAYLRAHERVTLVLGIDNPVSIQVDPIVDMDKLGTLLVFGPVVPIHDRVSWYATVETGGLFGSDGDSAKFLLRGTTGLRVIFGASAKQWRAF